MLRSTFAALSSPGRRAVTSLDVHAAYRVLGVAPGAAPDAVRQQYLHLARAHHPDVSNGDDTKMKSVNLAYELVQAHGAELAKQMRQQPASRNQASRGATTQQRAGNKFGDDLDDDDDGRNTNNSSGNSGARPRARRPKSNLSDAASWNARPEFEWTADIFNVDPAEGAHPNNQASAYNRHFSFADDAAIFRSVRSGANVAEVARTMGRTPFAIEHRMNSTQFKLRVQKLLKAVNYNEKGVSTTLHGSASATATDRTTAQQQGRARPQFARQVYAHSDTVYRAPVSAASASREGAPLFHHSEDVAGDDSAFAAHGMASAQGRSYANLVQFHRRRAK